jgi:hypothetical protein
MYNTFMDCHDQMVHNRFHLLLVAGELQGGQLRMESHDDSVVIQLPDHMNIHIIIT